MNARTTIYTGPEMAPWRRFLLRHSRKLAGTLACGWLSVFAGSAVLGLHPPRGLMSVLFVLFAAMLCAAIWATRERDRLVREAPLPRFLQRKLRDAYPHLEPKDVELVERGLRQFFLACQRSRRRFVAMPSRVVDSMWHEFILYTRAYREWCDLVVGRFVDHVPAEVLGRKTQTNDGLRRAWYWACRDEAIRPRAPSRLPQLFALDAKLAIAGGFHYVADCRGLVDSGAGSGIYCGDSFSDGRYSGDADGFGGSDSSSDNSGGNSDSGSSGSSDGDGGSSGCGSGCGGGGD